MLYLPAGTVCNFSSSSSCSHIAATVQQQSGIHSLVIWQSETASTAWQYTQEATILLPISPTAVSWLPVGLLGSSVNLSLAVACASGLIIFCKSHNGSWAQVAKLSSLVQPSGDLQWTHTGLPVITAGTQIAVVSNVLQTHVTGIHQQQALVQVPLAHVELETGGPLPEYAPAALALLIARGRIYAAGQVVRSVLLWLKLHAAQQDAAVSPPTNSSKHGSQLLPDTGLDILLASPTLKGFSNVISSLLLSLTGSKDAKNATDNAEGPDAANSGAALTGRHFNSDHHQGSAPAAADPFAFDGGAFGTSGNQNDARPQPSALADPYAFDAGTFGTHQEGAEPQQTVQQQSRPTNTSQDPYAFSMGVFDTSQEVNVQSPQQQSTQQPASDPFAFDAGAFALDNEQAQHLAPASALSDPYAFDAGAFGIPSEDEQQQQPHQVPTNQDQPGNTPDPFAFNLGAFGFSGEEQAEAQEPELATQQPVIAAADPFAFNPDAFDFGGSITQVATSTQEPEDNAPQILPAKTAKASAADPFAFDAGAFGMQDSSAPEVQAQQQPPPSGPPAVNPHASNVSGDDADNGPMRRHKLPITPQVAETSKTVPARQAPQQQPDNTLPSQQQNNKPQIHRPTATDSSQAATSPLTSDELQELQQLLQDVLTEHLTPVATAEQPQSPTSPASAADAPDSISTRAPGVLPPGLTAQETLTLLNIAHMLCKSPQPSQGGQRAETFAALLLKVAPVDWAALDGCGQKMVRSVQLATCSSHLLPGKP